jgi:transposase-like protein
MSSPDQTCPFCGSSEIELVSAWGGQLITSQLRCTSCNTHFEAVRNDFKIADGRDAEAAG